MRTMPRISGAVGAVLLMTFGIAAGDDIMTKQLLDSAMRQSVWTNIVKSTPKAAFVDGDEARQELLDAAVTHVVVCPQPQGDPMYAVFLNEKIGQPHGHYELVLPDGTLVGQPCNGNNVVASTDMMADINADGIVEFVSALPGQPVVSKGKTNEVDVLLVTPILPVQKPILTVIFNRRSQRLSLLSIALPDNYAEVQSWINGKTETPVRPKHLGKDYWFWRLAAPSTMQAEIQIGPLEKDQLVAKAAFRWCPQKKKFVGPSGNPEEGFMSFTGGERQTHVEAFCTGSK